MTWFMSIYTRAFIRGKNKVPSTKWKKTTWVFVFQKHGKYWLHLIKNKPLISDECTTYYYLIIALINQSTIYIILLTSFNKLFYITVTIDIKKIECTIYLLTKSDKYTFYDLEHAWYSKSSHSVVSHSVVFTIV